ncbi:MAG: nicotinamide-nucleotide amidohydrolase family protein [Candidatus Hydrogenedentes bacterium]|nr:nicotinamide-nucleotide amidohydrolase family protein [Candidatus Hydrogenedentota bacterium]
MNEPSESSLVKCLMVKGLTVSSAESCSGGLIAHRITNVPGSSACFLGGVVSYSNDAKERLLGVPHSALSAHGAVSEPVARAMAEGARGVFGTDHAIGVTGIAGPGGGTPEKPVGLVYIAVAGPRDTIVTKKFFTGTREAIKEQTADAALELLLEQLR